MEKLSKIYYSPLGYWRGETAVSKLSAASGVDKKTARKWLRKQPIWQIYAPKPKFVPRPYFNETRPNHTHQVDILYLPHDRHRNRTYKYALNVIDLASRYKASEPLTGKSSHQAADALERIYARGPLKWPTLLQFDPGKEFQGAFAQLLEKNGVRKRVGEIDNHRDQALVERYNQTLANRLFASQYVSELSSGVQNSAWVSNLQCVVNALNKERTSSIKMTPAKAIGLTEVKTQPVVYKRPVAEHEVALPANTMVRYLYAAGELEGGRRRATDPIWSVDVFGLKNGLLKKGMPLIYYLNGKKSPRRGFVREELQIVP